MQTSFQSDELDVYRAPDVSDARRYSASEESLEALKVRTTPIDNTNPYTSLHASCANAFIATAISIEHRYNEMHLHLPAPASGAGSAETTSALPVAVSLSENAAIPVMQTEHPMMADEAESQWNNHLLEWDLTLLPLQELRPELYQQQPDVMASEVMEPAAPLISQPQPVSNASTTAKAESDVIINNDYEDEDGNITFTGEAPAGSLLQFYIDELLVGSQEIKDDGQWQFALPADLPATQHTFSAMPVSAQGTVGSKIAVVFVIEPKPSVILLPIDDSELDLIDVALIESMAPLDETPAPLWPLQLTDVMLDGWQTQDGVSAYPSFGHSSLFDKEESETASITWH